MTSTRRPTSAGIEAVVVGVDAQVRVRRDAHRPAPRGVGHPVRQRRHHLQLVGEAIDRPRAQRLVRARVDLREPGVELVLEVELVGERRGRARSSSPRSPAAARRRPWPADRPARRSASRPCSWPQNAANASDGRPPWPWMPAWRSQTSVRGRPPRRSRQPAIPASRSSVCVEKTKHAGARARVAQARDHDPAAARLAVADRDLLARLPDIELADLARPIDRPLKRPRRAARTAAGPRAGSHRRPSWTRCSPAARAARGSGPRQLRDPRAAAGGSRP